MSDKSLGLRMYLQRDREEEYRARLLNLAQDQIRKVLEILRRLSLMSECLVNEDQPKRLEELYVEILKADESARDTKRLIESDVTNMGALLTNREDFLRLINDVDRIADIAEGAAFRIVSLIRMKLRLQKEVVKSIYGLSEGVLQTVNKLREALLAVTLDSETFISKVKETEEAERKVDELYRNTDLGILQSDMKITQLLLSREIVSMLEDIADKSEDAVDTLRSLSFVIL